MAKLTISVRAETRKQIDERAAALGVTRSAFVEQLVDAEAERIRTRLLEEGYRATRKNNVEFAERAIPLAWEVAQHGDPAW